MNRRATATAGRNARRTHAAQIVNEENVAERFQVRNVTTPSESYPPGGRVTVTVEYGSDSGASLVGAQVDQDHPDFCRPGFFSGAFGGNVYVACRVEGGTSATSQAECLDYDNTRPLFKEFALAAPTTSGPVNVTAEVRGERTNQVYSSATKQILVDDGTSGEPGSDDGGDGENGGSGDNGDDECGFVDQLLGTCEDGGGDSPLLGTEQTIALAAFAILVIVAVSATQ